MRHLSTILANATTLPHENSPHLVVPAALNDELLGNLLMRDNDTVTVQLGRPVSAYKCSTLDMSCSPIPASQLAVEQVIFHPHLQL
jgi:hypothetical protein